MRFNRLSLLSRVFVSIALTIPAVAADDKATFLAKPAADYPHKMTSEKVTIAAEAYITDDQAKDAFGKGNPWRFGVLPVLVVIQNDTPHALRVDRARFVYVLPDRSKVESTPAGELKFLLGPNQPKSLPGTKLPIKLGKGKQSPLAAWEIEGRAFLAKMIPAGQSASGFVYFQAPNTSDAASVYISGLIDAVTGAELYYFDIAMSGK